jgi:DNA replication protein DnaC
MKSSEDSKKRLIDLLRELHLPALRDGFEEAARRAEKESLSYEQYLLDLVEGEIEQRHQRKVDRLLQGSRLPREKTLESFDLKRLPQKTQHQVRSLIDGSFVDRKENLLAFGKPGSGKSHLIFGIAHELVHQRRRVLATTCSLLVQDLLAAKRDLKLTRALKRLSVFDAIVIDDIGYVQHDREEMEVLFTLLADRYERGTVMITSNLPFSKWESIFKDPMTTAAAIDRVVHHSIIIELNIDSYRMEQAKKNKDKEAS